MNALQHFRTGKDYIEIAEEMRLSVPEVERQIHRLRNYEKGDTTQEEYNEHLRRQKERLLERKIRTVARLSLIKGAEFLGQVRP